MARTPAFQHLMRLLFEDEVRPGRRRFLTKSAGLATGAAASLALPACGNFDRWVLGDNHHLNTEVMILGGGLAGLSAAYHLKKSKIPFRLFEASSRIGGRVQTLRHFNADQQFAETGAEFFESGHKAVHQLCKDLGLNAQDVSYDTKSDRGLYWLKGRIVSEKDFKKSLRPVALKLAQARQEVFAAIPTEITARSLASFPRAAVVDQQSLADLLTALKSTVPDEILGCFESLCVSEWGVESKSINLLQFLIRLDFEERALAGGQTKMYRVEGGTSQLVEVLAERAQGVVAGSSLLLEYQLVALRERGGGYECTFRTPNGSDTYWARQVICTLPWSVLKDVAGIQSVDLGVAARELISKSVYATHSKVISSFRDPFWKKKAAGKPRFQGIFRGELLGQNYWDSSRGQAGSRGLLTSQRGGERGQGTGVTAPAESLKDLKNFSKEISAEEISHVTNWSQKPFARGSRYNVPPGSYLKYLEFLNDENDKVTFYFAGEHASFKDFGTMNGAIESAVAAADKAMQKAFLKSFL
jgi:monoamine oxidase